jgi:hypothetical protein
MIDIYISTFNRINLAINAAKSLQKNLLDQDYRIILLCGIGYKDHYKNDIFDNIIESEFLNPGIRRMGFIKAYQNSLLSNAELSVSIDDDIRLIYKISLLERYTKDKYVPDNTFCVQVWRDCTKKYYEHLKVQRLNHINQFIGDNKILGQLAVNNWSEQIDTVWLHIDKGSEKMTPARQSLIDYIDK